jgi:hypothetical protein
MFTGRQQAEFRPLVKRAWAEVCRRSGWVDTPSGRETWYRAEVKSILGVDSTRSADPVRDFDRLMLSFATLANDTELIGYYSAADERRALHQLQNTINNAARAGVEISEPYLSGIARRMGFGDRPLTELPAVQILKINTACFIHWKRREKELQAAASVPF